MANGAARVAGATLVFLASAWPAFTTLDPNGFLMTPDAIEHVSIANAVATGHGFVNPIQWYFTLPGPPPVPAAATRAPVLPALLAVGMWAGADLSRLIYAHIVFAGLVAVGLFLLACRCMRPGFATVATLLVVLTTTWSTVRASPLSEVTAMAAFLLVLATARGAARSWARALLCASATVLAWLARPNLAPLGLAVVVAAGWDVRRPRAFLRSPVLLYAIALFLGISGVGWLSETFTGFRPYEAYKNAFEHFPVVRAFHYGSEYVGTLPFIWAHLDEVVSACATNASRLFVGLFLEPRFFYVGWLGLLGTIVVVRSPSRASVEERMFVLSALGFAAIIILTYPAFARLRYPLFPATAGILAGMAALERIVTVWETQRAWLRATWLALSGWALLVCASLAFVVPLVLASRAVNASEDARVAAVGHLEKICAAMEPGRLVMTDEPWPVHWWCGNPTIRVPGDLRDPAIAERFLADQKPRYFVTYRKAWLRWATRDKRMMFRATNGRTAVFELKDRVSNGPAPRPIRPPRCLVDPTMARCDGDRTAKNVVLILADTLRADALSTYGYSRPTTPRLDAFARESVVFENAISVGASTPPTLSAVMTGRLPYYERSSLWGPKSAHGMRRFYRDGERAGLPYSLETLAERFKRAGYDTMGVVTNAYVKKVYHFDQGFDEFVEIFHKGTPHYGTAEEVTKRAESFLAEPRDAPFFLYLHYMDPHVPYVPPEPYKSEFASGGAEWWVAQRDSYDASIRYMDHWIGELLERLARDDLRDRTIIAFLSDHGEEFGDHGGMGHNGTLYEELVHVPLLLHGPGMPARRTDALVRNFDIGPTLLELAGVGRFQGDPDAVSLAPIVRGEVGEARPVVASFPLIGKRATAPHRPARRMIRDDRYKLIDDLRDPEKSALFDLRDDPREETNVYESRPDVVARLRRALDGVIGKLAREAAGSVSALRLGPATGLARLEAVRGTRVIALPQGVRLVSRKTAPAIELPYLPVSPGEDLFVRVETAPNAPLPRLLYRSARDGELRPDRAIDGHRSEAGDSVEFVLRDTEIVGPLRMVFGEQPGEVVLGSITMAKERGALVDAAGSASVGEEGVDPETLDQLRALGYVD